MPRPSKTEQVRRKYLKTSCRARGREERTNPDDIAEFLSLTHDPDARVRREAVQCLCPCHVQTNHPGVWDRLLEMVTDPDLKVRATVLHTLGDGSPRAREAEVVAAIEKIYHEPDLKLRRHVRQLLASYRRQGNINVL
ncbi:MAG: HEAT repeat domain-containing protein [Abitibacteriaceae bacterium]|nr:HEAT repeat domain-containing protein [Abditibacteriaceae bacterium]MBV9867066.1 HEAT repeat domain-containing protein [Abditibacteriaceae bacterium]